MDSPYKRAYYYAQELIINHLNNPNELTRGLLIKEFDLNICPICKEYCADLVDTEGIANGGVGFVCEGCKADM
jgi:hypothetical protein